MLERTFELLGGSQQFLKRWIVFQLYEDMKSENCGVDFVSHYTLPIISFNLFNENELKKSFNWINLRPMRSKENLSKGAKIDFWL